MIPAENPAAFPCIDTDDPGAASYTSHPGMGLRDYFAAHALQCMLATPKYPDECLHGNDDPKLADWQQHYAKVAYGYADAMLAARAAPVSDSDLLAACKAGL